MTELRVEGPAIPPSVLGAVKGLWEAGFRKEEQAFQSGSFRLLLQNCSAVYLKFSGSRLAKPHDFDRRELREALHSFFRWTGAPWYSKRRFPSSEEAAAELHAGFLLRKVRRKYVVPLDRLGLYETARGRRGETQELRQLRFGPCELVVLDKAGFAEHVRADALARFGERYRLDPEKFAEFYYLLTTADEEAGPIWKRAGGFSRLMRTHVDSRLLQPRLYEAVYPEVVGSAIFTMLLRFEEDRRDVDSEPFAVPWVYSVTDDPFSHPADNSTSDDLFSRPQIPDPSSLTWTTLGDPDDEISVPDRGREPLKFEKEEIERALQETWDGLQAALSGRQLHPLAKHFFLKGLRDGGIDQINSNLSCIEATLMLAHESNGRCKMFRRYRHLVGDEACLKWLKGGYDLRDKYLHSLGGPRERFSWEDLARTRWAITKAVDAYLNLAAERPGERRKALLRSLNRRPGGESCRSEGAASLGRA